MEVSQLQEMFPKIDLDIIQLLVQEYNDDNLLDILLELSKDEEELNYVRDSYIDSNNTLTVPTNNNNNVGPKANTNDHYAHSFNEDFNTQIVDEYDEYSTEKIESEFPNTSLIPDNSDEGVGYCYPKEKKNTFPSISNIINNFRQRKKEKKAKYLTLNEFNRDNL